MALGAFDYVVLTVTLLASAAIGVYYRLTGGKQQTTRVKHNNMHILYITLQYIFT